MLRFKVSLFSTMLVLNLKKMCVQPATHHTLTIALNVYPEFS